MTSLGAKPNLIFRFGLEIEEHNGLLDPRVDLSPGGETVAHQTDRELSTQLVRIAQRLQVGSIRPIARGVFASVPMHTNAAT